MVGMGVGHHDMPDVVGLDGADGQLVHERRREREDRRGGPAMRAPRHSLARGEEPLRVAGVDDQDAVTGMDDPGGIRGDVRARPRGAAPHEMTALAASAGVEQLDMNLGHGGPFSTGAGPRPG